MTRPPFTLLLRLASLFEPMMHSDAIDRISHSLCHLGCMVDYANPCFGNKVKYTSLFGDHHHARHQNSSTPLFPLPRCLHLSTSCLHQTAAQRSKGGIGVVTGGNDSGGSGDGHSGGSGGSESSGDGDSGDGVAGSSTPTFHSLTQYFNRHKTGGAPHDPWSSNPTVFTMIYPHANHVASPGSTLLSLP